MNKWCKLASGVKANGVKQGLGEPIGFLSDVLHLLA